MSIPNPVQPPLTYTLSQRTAWVRPHGGLRRGVSALLTLLFIGLGAACGEAIVGFPAEDTVAPTVTSTSPEAGATEVPLNTVISATFSEAMDPQTIDNDSFLVARGSVLVPGTVSYVGVSALFVPNTPLAPETVYTVRVRNSVTDLAGNAMNADHEWSFTSGESDDTTAPTIVRTVPVDDALQVPLNRRITATFSEAMAPETLNAQTFLLFEGANQIQGEITYTGVVATFTPTELLDPLTSYIATVMDVVTDLAGNPMGTIESWSFTTGTTSDTQAPSVVSTNPMDGATSAPVAGTVSAVFDEAMDAATITTESFTLELLGASVAGTVTYDGAVAIFHPSAELEAFSTYSATIFATASDLAGNMMLEDYEWEFTTGPAIDTSAPAVSSTSPARNATNVASNASVSATFTREMDPASISTGTFTIFDGSDPVFGTVTYSGVTATFAPASPLADETVFTATIGAGAQDLAGNALAADYTWDFTTGVSPDVTAPRVTFTSPANGVLDAPYNAPITATFSEAMRASTLNADTFRLFDGPTQLTGTVSYVGVTATFAPSAPLEQFTTYTARIDGSVEDLAGNVMGDEYVWSFTTGLVPDTTAPFVVSTVPDADALQVPINTKVTATFSEAMAPLTLNTNTFLLFEGTEQVAGSVTYTGLIATFSPAASLNPSSTYTAIVLGSVTDLAGNPMGADHTWTFDTGTTPDTQAPSVISTDPVDGAVDAPVTGKVSAIFDEPMDAATLTTASFTLERAGTPVVGTVTYDGAVAIFHPGATLEAFTTYSAMISTVAADLAGNRMVEDYTWEFMTGPADDTTPPEVTSTMPMSDAVDVASDTSLSATFSKAMDPLSISTATFTLFNGSTPVYGAVTYEGTTATFVPENSLADDTVFTATIGARAQDLAGNQLGADYTWEFTTGITPDVTPPTVTFTLPANGQLDAPFDASIIATFSKAMDPATLSSSTFRLFDGTALVAGSVSYTNFSATLEPAEPLKAFTTYTARIDGSVTDDAGLAMGNEYVWSFTTGFVPDTTPPVIVSTDPADNEVLVLFDATISATFSETMDASTLNGTNFFVTMDDLPVAGSISYSGVTATFLPESPLEPLSLYTATVSGNVTDLAGNPMGDDYIWSFETGPIPDTTRPRVTFTVPQDDATGVPVNSSIAATFSEPMDASTITTESFTVQQLDTVVPGTVSYVGLTATFRPLVNLDPLTIYSATVTTMATDLAGNELLTNYVWNFRTGIAPDSSSPFVLATNPQDGDMDVLLNTTITVLFSESMDALTINDDSFFVVDELDVIVEGSVTLVGSTAVFTPDNLLQEFMEYTAVVTVDAADLGGNNLQDDHVWMFTTGPALDDGAPFVVSTNPEDAETGVPRTTSVNATFSEAMDPLTINNANFELWGPGTTTVEGTVVYDALTNIATFLPLLDLLPDTLYSATISTDVRDLAGNEMLFEYVWNFATGEVLNGFGAVNLGSLSTFVAAAGAGLTNSNSGGVTTLNGNVALYPTGTCLGDGTDCSIINPIINGVLYANDPEGIAEQAKNDLIAAYVDAMSRPPGTVVSGLAGLTLAPGVYSSGSEISIAVGGVLTLDGQGDANAVWIFQAGSEITINNGAQILTINGARAKNVFWAAGSSSTIGSNVSFQGSVLAQESNSVGTGSVVIGRLLCTTGAITLLSNTITLPPN